MKMKKLLACALISLIAASPVAMADQIKPGDPTPNPIETPAPSPTPAPKPGDAKPQQGGSITIRTTVNIRFPSPHSPGKADFFNPETATTDVVYVLQISVAELERMAGTTGYTDEEYAELSAQEGFDPETSYVILCQTEPLAPGEGAEEILLSALPNGRFLPVGSYNVQVQTIAIAAEEASDGAEMKPGLTVNLKAATAITIESDALIMTVDGDNMIDLNAFNPVSSQNDLIYSLQLSQLELQNVSGSNHRTQAELVAQATDINFLPEYEFISLYESEPVAPGEAVRRVQLSPLPDGQPLPSGEYQGWLVKYAVSEATGERTQLDVDTEITLLVPSPEAS